MKDAFVIGYGMVGKATAKALDIPYYFSRKKSNITLEEGAKKKYCLICLPTPTDAKGSQAKAIKVIKDYIIQIKEYKGKNVFVIRSTVLPGTCKALAETTKATVVSCPEFLSEATAEEDAKHPRIKVMGADTPESKEAVKELFKSIKSKIEITTDTVTSETIKYAFNCFGMVKVVFANQLYDACQLSGANYDTVRKALHEHPWGSKHHLRVVDKGGRGAGGRCLPKDVEAFATFSNSDFLKKTIEINKKYLQESKKE